MAHTRAERENRENQNRRAKTGDEERESETVRERKNKNTLRENIGLLDQCCINPNWVTF